MKMKTCLIWIKIEFDLLSVLLFIYFFFAVQYSHVAETKVFVPKMTKHFCAKKNVSFQTTETNSINGKFNWWATK